MSESKDQEADMMRRSGYGSIPNTPVKTLGLNCPSCHKEVQTRHFARFIEASRKTWSDHEVLIDQSCESQCAYNDCKATIIVKFIKPAGDLKPYFVVHSTPFKPETTWVDTAKVLALEVTSMYANVIFVGGAAALAYQTFKYCNDGFET